MILTTDRTGYAQHVKVAAIGGGACRALDRMLAQWPRPPCTVAVDTDDRSLDTGQTAARLPLGARLAKGFGCGGDPRVGKLAAEESIAEWRTLCSDTDWLILLAALGGGTATGAAPVLARVAMDVGTRVMAVATLPFEFEGADTSERARRGLVHLHEACDAVVAVPNSGLLASVPAAAASASEAFQAADGAIGFLLSALGRMVLGQGLLTLDLNSIRRILHGRAQPAAFGWGSATGAQRAAAALADLQACPTLADDRRLAAADAAMVGVLAGASLAFSEIEATLAAVRAAMKPEALLVTGVTVDHAYGEAFHLVTMTAGAARKQDQLLDSDPVTPAARPGRRPGAVRPPTHDQEQLEFDTPVKGRFKDVAPTIVEGQDLDIPTFVRRQLRFERAR